MTTQTSNGLKTANGKEKGALYNMGTSLKRIIDASWSRDATWSDDDIIVLAKNLSYGDTITKIMQLGGDDLAGMTDVDFGFRRSDTEVVIDADILADGVSFATASVRDILGSGLTFDRTKTIGELLGKLLSQQPQNGVDLIATVNTSGVAVGDTPMHIGIVSQVA